MCLIVLTVLDEDTPPASMNCDRGLSLQFQQRLSLVTLGEDVSLCFLI